MKLSRFADFSENMYLCHDISYKILELDDERINFKNYGIETCSGCGFGQIAQLSVIATFEFLIEK